MASADDTRGPKRRCAGHGREYGGEGGIRTHVTLSGKTVFETVLINHSSTSPRPIGTADYTYRYLRKLAMTFIFTAFGQSTVFTFIGKLSVSSF